MAEEEDLALEGPEDEVASVEDTKVEAEAVVGEAPPDPIEVLASELGWAPKDQFRGSPDEWKPAADFIKAGKDIQRTLSRDVKDLRSTVDNMSRTSAAILEQQLARQKAEIEARFNDAVEQGDTPGAKAAYEELRGIEQRAVPSRGPDPAGQSFVERNASWWQKDQDATRYAIQRADYYAQQGVSGERQTRAVEQDMKSIFPELFPAPAKAPPTVARPGSRAATATNRAKSFHDLPPKAQDVARDMADRGVIPNVEAYVTNYFKEKVG